MLIFLRAVDAGEDPWAALMRAGHNRSVSTPNALRARGMLVVRLRKYQLTPIGRRAIIGT
jgi:hypothetical protein